MTRIWNVWFSNIGLDEALTSAKSAIQSRDLLSIAFVNPHSQVVASKDDAFRRALDNFSMVLADGVGVILGARIAGEKLKARISGPQYFDALSRSLDEEKRRFRYFFLGSTENVLQRIVHRMESDFPAIVVAGVYSPPMGKFSDEDDKKIVSMIRESEADVLWVGMTAPKQEKWIVEFGDQTGVSVVAGIGAEFDYFAGTKKRPSKWISNMGLQWLHRFFQEPRRTWRRHLVSAPIFLLNVLRSRGRKDLP